MRKVTKESLHAFYLGLYIMKERNTIMSHTAKTRIFTLGVAIILILGMTGISALAHNSFPDVPAGAPYAHEVNTLAAEGIFRGDANGNFNPNSSMTRAEAATLLVRLFVDVEVATSGARSFTDVPSSHWAFSYIETAFAFGLISGYGDGRFGPSDPLTYNQALALLIRALNYGPMAEAWGGWPAGYIEAAEELGLSDRTVSTGNNPVPRSTVAVLIYNALYNIGLHDGDSGHNGHHHDYNPDDVGD